MEVGPPSSGNRMQVRSASSPGTVTTVVADEAGIPIPLVHACGCLSSAERHPLLGGIL